MQGHVMNTSNVAGDLQGPPGKGNQVATVESFIVASGKAKDWVFVKIVTGDGVVGWGECYTGRDREVAIASLVDSIGRYLVGRDVFGIKNFTTAAFLDIARKRGSMEFYCALSGIEAAMWDAVGKTVGQPVYNLLGGACRDRIRVYANGWSYNPHGGTTDGDEAARSAEEMVRRGFTALKFDPFIGPWRANVTRADIDAAVARFAAVRRAVGPDVDLLVEAHRRLNPATAAAFADLIAEHRPYWLEEPVPSSNPQGLAEIRQRCGMPVVTGEELYTKTAFLPIFAARAADILNPDIANCGGILELVEICAMADAHQLLVSPHNYNSTTVGLAATVQACAVMPNFLITEYFVNFADRGSEFCTGLELEAGYIRLPMTPGLGIEMDEKVMRRYQPNADRPTRVMGRFFED